MKVILIVFAVTFLVQVTPSNSFPLNACCGAPLTLPLPLPATIPLGNICTCKPIALKPTLLPSCGCPLPCQPPLNPLLLKQLLPLLLPSLLGAATC